MTVRFLEKEINDALNNIKAHDLSAKAHDEKAEAQRKMKAEYEAQYDELMLDLEKIDPKLYEIYRISETPPMTDPRMGPPNPPTPPGPRPFG